MTGRAADTGGVIPLIRSLRERIGGAGRITFAEFMEAALFSPLGGYYARPGRIAAQGDFFTAPSAHPAFGALICVQLREVAGLLRDPDSFTAIEMGAGDGTLARDVTRYATRLDPDFAGHLRYVAVDRALTPAARGGACEPQPVRSNGLPFRGATGCIVSNELLDSFPVHRFIIRDGEVREIYVALDGDRFAEEEGPPSTLAIEARLRLAGRLLPDGYRGEVNLGLDAWADDVSAALERGVVLTVDYGHTADALYAPGRSAGTIRCHYRHTLGSDPLGRVGDQDITAHVDFTTVDAVLRRRGFVRIGATTQAGFLHALGLRSMVRRLRAVCGTQAALDANRMAMLALARSDGLGAFKVMAHAKAIGSPTLTGFRAGEPPAWTEKLPVPLLDPQAGHMTLLEGAYPHTASIGRPTLPRHPSS